MSPTNTGDAQAIEPQQSPIVLVVEDEAIARKNLVHVLERQGLRAEAASDGAQALSMLEGTEYDLVITDLVMQGADGLDVLRRAKELWPDTEVIVVTGYPTVETAVEAMRRGAYDYMVKPYRIDEARMLARKALEKRSLRLEVQALRESVESLGDPVTLIGAAPPMEALRRTIDRVAPTESTVLIQGETGTGKELVARSLHMVSRRAGKRFLAINCGAFNDELLENELFGHEQGAFSGANRMKKGLFEAAQGGTLFLDEVGEMSLAMQVKLLRALQERTIRRVGGTQDVEVDVRVIAATNKDLKDEVEAGRFRADLFFRLNVITLSVPLLSERRGDIPLLAHYFLARISRRLGRAAPVLSPEVLDLLSAYAYPGNVRELQNIVERATVMAEGDVVEPRHLPPDLAHPAFRVTRAQEAPPPPAEDEGEPVSLEENERRHISRVMRHADGNKSKAARILGIDRVSLWRKLRRLGLE
ncbi:two component, sigma54 specific, transcriptional regulator, Fis family [Desulfovibrio sp. X2]|uniref:sigma-54-dependent transcriptional regulator n=1 Tax=Desulfovibrio sp. X2 TaxID=941449 RepID=UPI000358F081|nr:sigma-54 dependent transcriptional regulator [Desulfovibrio sp. X2]EPR43701.1 two component, sigma54 specific, transcriptional regulator, Fis family [Desulfovibrio sp. X2]